MSTDKEKESKAKKESFTICIPFNIPPSRLIKDISEEITLQVEGFEAKVINEKIFYVLEVYGFNSKEGALQFLPKLISGLYLCSLQHKIGITFDPSPSEVDTSYDRAKTVIRPEHKKPSSSKCFRATITTTINNSDFSKSLTEALSFTTPERILEDDKLKLALEFYSNSFFENTGNSIFIMLVIALETLITDEKVSDIECEEVFRRSKSKLQMPRESLEQSKQIKRTLYRRRTKNIGKKRITG